MLASNIKREVCGILNGFLSFLKTYEGNKAHNMLSLMLVPRFKSLRLVSSLIDRKQAISIGEEYDQQSLFPMLLRCYHILQPMVEFGLVADMQTDEENNLDIFQMFVGTSEPTKEVVNKELMMFKRFQVDFKDNKYPLKWWAKHISISNCGISCSLDSWHYWFSNDFFFIWLEFLQI